MANKNKNSPSNDNAEESEVISKTQIKQKVHELQDLAKVITEMPKKKVAQLDLPTTFLDAMEESKRIKSHIARKRHFQYMGKILFKIDYESVLAKIERVENLDGHYQVRDAIINLWIEQFTDHETPLFNHLYQHHDQDILSSLRQTLRNHLKKADHAANRKKLFQALRELDNKAELPNPITLI